MKSWIITGREGRGDRRRGGGGEVVEVEGGGAGENNGQEKVESRKNGGRGVTALEKGRRRIRENKKKEQVLKSVETHRKSSISWGIPIIWLQNSTLSVIDRIYRETLCHGRTDV